MARTPKEGSPGVRAGRRMSEQPTTSTERVPEAVMTDLDWYALGFIAVLVVLVLILNS